LRELLIMNTIVLWAALMLQVQFNVQVSVPTVRFEVAPPVVEVQPGVFVVHDYNEEVFVVGGLYWMRGGDGRWYRARDYRGSWAVAAPPTVPAVLVRSPPGRYKHYKEKPQKYRVVNADGSVTEYKVKEKNGVTEVKVKEKKWKKGKGKWK
jgi:hypothetical protein